MGIATDTTTPADGVPAVTVLPEGHHHRHISRMLILPGVVLLLLLVLFPVVMEVYISLTTWTPTSGSQWYLAYRDVRF